MSRAKLEIEERTCRRKADERRTWAEQDVVPEDLRQEFLEEAASFEEAASLLAKAMRTKPSRRTKTLRRDVSVGDTVLIKESSQQLGVVTISALDGLRIDTGEFGYTREDPLEETTAPTDGGYHGVTKHRHIIAVLDSSPVGEDGG